MKFRRALTTFAHGVACSAVLLLVACQVDRGQSAPEQAGVAQSGTEGPEMPKAPSAQKGTEREPSPETNKATFGNSISPGPDTPLAEVLAAPEKYKDQTVRVSGQVRRACSRKGCWMEIASTAQEESPTCRVTFKDYAFFVPTNSPGKSARVEAVVQVKEVKPARVQHLEAEGATFRNKNPDGSATEVQLVASGVELSST